MHVSFRKRDPGGWHILRLPGIAVTGSLAIVQLQGFGISLSDAVLIATVFRVGTIARRSSSPPGSWFVK
jgi:hypothetical protein